MIRQSRVAKSDDIKVTFALPHSEPDGSVSVVGDFNDWSPGKHVLAKRTNGTRSVSVTVPAGTKVRFRYLGEQGRWFDDPEADHDGDASIVSV